MNPGARKQRIAVVGCGVAGLTAAWLLQRKHEVFLYERNDYAGGHTRTLHIPDGIDAGLPVDTGFIVMNHRNYPNFTKVLEQLGVELADSSMTFSFYDQASSYGYSGNSLGSLFPKPSYFFNKQHLSLILDLRRFAKIGYRDLNSGYLARKQLGDYCRSRGFGSAFLQHYLYPMGAAIWSSPIAEMHKFPALPYLHFLENHGLLRLTNRPQWRYVKGGSRSYVSAMLKTFQHSPKLSAAPQSIRRNTKGVLIKNQAGEDEQFDHVVIATHADEALKLLQDPSDNEQAKLKPWRYQENTVTLHTDRNFLPPSRKLWSSWNFIREAGQKDDRPVSVSYYMNRLQAIKSDQAYVVTLNAQQAIAPEKIINTTSLTHPLYSFESMDTQDELQASNGEQNTWFCGSYFGYGFHEDAVRSAVQIANRFDIDL